MLVTLGWKGRMMFTVTQRPWPSGKSPYGEKNFSHCFCNLSRRAAEFPLKLALYEPDLPLLEGETSTWPLVPIVFSHWVWKYKKPFALHPLGHLWESFIDRCWGIWIIDEAKRGPWGWMGIPKKRIASLLSFLPKGKSFQASQRGGTE